MRNALLTFGALGGAALTLLLLAGALVDEVTAPTVDSALLARMPATYRPDLTQRCTIRVCERVDFIDPASAQALGVTVADGCFTLAVSCGAVASLLNHASTCTLDSDRPSGWPPPAFGDAAACPAAP